MKFIKTFFRDLWNLEKIVFFLKYFTFPVITLLLFLIYQSYNRLNVGDSDLICNAGRITNAQFTDTITYSHSRRGVNQKVHHKKLHLTLNNNYTYVMTDELYEGTVYSLNSDKKFESNYTIGDLISIYTLPGTNQIYKIEKEGKLILNIKKIQNTFKRDILISASLIFILLILYYFFYLRPKRKDINLPTKKEIRMVKAKERKRLKNKRT